MIVITGASDGLGKELTQLFVADQRAVMNVSRTANPEATYNVQADLSTDEGIVAATREILDMDEPLEVLINCAGVLSLEKLSELSAGELDRLYAVNMRAPILLTSRLIERITHDATDVVNINSTAGRWPYRGQVSYDASKWALRGFTEDLRLELAESDARVIGIYPDMFESDIAQKIPGKTVPKSKHPAMDAKELASIIKHTVDLPKNMQVTDLVIERKVVR